MASCSLDCDSFQKPSNVRRPSEWLNTRSNELCNYDMLIGPRFLHIWGSDIRIDGFSNGQNKATTSGANGGQCNSPSLHHCGPRIDQFRPHSPQIFIPRERWRVKNGGSTRWGCACKVFPGALTSSSFRPALHAARITRLLECLAANSPPLRKIRLLLSILCSEKLPRNLSTSASSTPHRGKSLSKYTTNATSNESGEDLTF